MRKSNEDDLRLWQRLDALIALLLKSTSETGKVDRKRQKEFLSGFGFSPTEASKIMGIDPRNYSKF